MLASPVILLSLGVGLVQLATVVDRNNNATTCHDPQREFYPYVSTRTAYERAHGNISRPDSTCSPVQIWMLARHGTRYPGQSIVPKLLDLPKVRDQILKNHEQGDGLLCAKDLENLRIWEMDASVNKAMADSLAPQGMDDLRLLAKRLQGAFPELLQVDPESVNPDDYVFRATDTQRTQASLKSFARGLFGSSNVIKIEDPPVNDTLLLTHKNCPAWEASYDPVLTNAERDKFTAGPEVQALLRSLSQRLGFNKTLDFDTVKTMYELCRFEAAWYLNRTSVWCSLFTKEDLKILEYREDINYYYCCGPGRELSSKLGCQTLSDMFNRFKNLESGNYTNQPKGVFYFSHSIPLQMLMGALKISKESKPLSATGYASSEDRKFRTSLLGPFATNVAAVFYRCNGDKHPNKVMFYVAERLQRMAGCEDGLCNWESLKRDFAPQVDECSMDVCYESPETTTVKTNASHGTPELSYGLMKFAIALILVQWLRDRV